MKTYDYIRLSGGEYILPITLIQRPDHEDGVTYIIEVFGVLDTPSSPLVIFRMSTYQVFEQHGNIEMLPLPEFDLAYGHWQMR